MASLKNGYIQVYCGNGKGKTTAALGLGMRAAGEGYTVSMIQFLKTFKTGELESVKQLQTNFNIYRFESKRDFFWNLNETEKDELKAEIEKAYDFAISLLRDNKCDILILDEFLGVLENNLLTQKQAVSLIELKPRHIELVLTGRNIPQYIASRADLITEMKEVKHYYNSGVAARRGIEF